MDTPESMDTNDNRVIVYHAADTSDDKAPDGSAWIDYWMEHTNLPCPEICPCCGKKPTGDNYFVGAHVKKLMDFMEKEDSGIFIVPTCDICNKSSRGWKSFENAFPVPPEYLLRIH